MSKGQSLSVKVARQQIVDETVIAAVGRGRPVEVRTVGALVHVVILNSRRALAVASILNRARKAALSAETQAPRSDEPTKI